MDAVRAAIDLVFAVESRTVPQAKINVSQERDSSASTASLLAMHVAATDESTARLATLIRDEITSSGNPQRAATSLARIAISLEKEDPPQGISEPEARALVRLCGVSETFGEMIANRPSLIHSLPVNEPQPPRNYSSDLQSAIDDSDSFASDLDALRRAWSRLLIEIGANDAAHEMPLPEVNRSLTELAVASMNSALTIAEREMNRRHQDVGKFRVAVLGLGRL